MLLGVYEPTLHEEDRTRSAAHVIGNVYKYIFIYVTFALLYFLQKIVRSLYLFQGELKKECFMRL